MLLFQYKQGAIVPTSFRSFKISNAASGIDRSYGITTSGRDVYIPGTTRIGTIYYGTIVKYTGGTTADWKYRFNLDGSNSGSMGSTVASDSGGNVYAIEVQVQSNNRRYFITKFTSAGAVTWRKVYYMSLASTAVTTGDRKPAIAIDSSNNIYICDGVKDPTSGQARAMVCKLDSSDGSVTWSSTWRLGTGGDTHTDYFNSVDTDAAGNVYATGYSYNGSDYRLILMKINPTTGARVWQRNLDVATTTEEGYSVSVSPAGSVHVCGSYGNPTRGLVVKFDTDGTELWRHGIVINTTTEIAYNIEVDSNDDVVVNTFFGGTGSYKFKLFKYNSAGTELWQYNIDGEVTSDIPLNQTALTVDAYNNIFAIFGGKWDGVPGDPDDHVFLVSCPSTGPEVGTYDGSSGRILSVTTATDDVTSTNANAITLTSTAYLNEDLATSVFSSVSDASEQTPVDLSVFFIENTYPKQ